jgi:hypothetical protein
MRVMGIQRCPKCRLINPPEAQRCDCGWDFVSRRHERSYLAKTAVPAAIGGGLVILIIVFKLLMSLVLSGTARP